jgi:hypothetical protein
MPYPTKSTPPAVFLNLTLILAVLATIGFGALGLFAHRFGDDPVLLARVRLLSGATAAISFVVAVLAFLGKRWLTT